MSLIRICAAQGGGGGRRRGRGVRGGSPAGACSLQLPRQIVCHGVVSATEVELAVRRAEHDTQIYLLGS